MLLLVIVATGCQEWTGGAGRGSETLDSASVAQLLYPRLDTTVSKAGHVTTTVITRGEPDLYHWTERRETSPMDDAVTVTISRRALSAGNRDASSQGSTSSLEITCSAAKKDVEINAARVLHHQNGLTNVRWRLGNGEVVPERWNVEFFLKASPVDGAGFLRRIVGGDTLVVEFETGLTNPTKEYAVFLLNGLDDHLGSIEEACGWSGLTDLAPTKVAASLPARGAPEVQSGQSHVERALARQTRLLRNDPAKRQLYDQVTNVDSAFTVAARIAESGRLAYLEGEELAVYSRVFGRSYGRFPREVCENAANDIKDSPAVSAMKQRVVFEVLTAADSSEAEIYASATINLIAAHIANAPLPKVSDEDFIVARDLFFESLPDDVLSQITNALTNRASIPSAQVCQGMSQLFLRAADMGEPYRTNILRYILM